MEDNLEKAFKVKSTKGNLSKANS